MKGRQHSLHGSGCPPGHELNILRHELRNLLNGMLGMSALLTERGGLDREQSRWMAAIEQSVRQIAALVDSCVPVAGRRGNICPRLRHIDGIGLLEAVLTSQQPAASASGHRLLLVAGVGLARRWFGDPCLLRQMLDNLVGNAIKYALPGDIVIEAGPEASRPGWLALRVEDPGQRGGEGPGDWMFEAYRRGAAAGIGEHDGNGLGLYICRRTAEALGGDIRCGPGREGGTFFEFRVPAVLERTPADRALPTRLFSGLQLRLALDGALLRSVASLLDCLGIPASAAGDGPEQPGRLPVLLKDPGADREEFPPCPGMPALVIEPCCQLDGLPAAIAVPAPVLESTLGPALLTMALGWQAAERGGSGKSRYPP